REVGEAPGGQVRGLAFQVPERAVDRVASGATRDAKPERLPIHPGSDVRTKRLDRRDNAVDGLAVARIGHTLPAPAHFTSVGSDGRQLHDHHRGLPLRAARDGESTAYGVALPPNYQ